MTPFDIASINKRFSEAEHSYGKPIFYLEETSSTNDEAAILARAGASHGTVVIADHQRKARGRGGKPWYSEPNTNLAFSLVLRPRVPITHLPAITLVMGLAVAEAVETFVDVPAGIKWPNDVLLRGRKVSGILVESSLSQDRCEYVIAGMGINVLQRSFPSAIEARATSIVLETHRTVTREEVLWQVIMRLALRLESFESGALPELMAEVAKRDEVRGRKVQVGDVQGVADGIDQSGELRVILTGRVQTVRAGEVTFVD